MGNKSADGATVFSAPFKYVDAADFLIEQPKFSERYESQLTHPSGDSTNLPIRAASVVPAVSVVATPPMPAQTDIPDINTDYVAGITVDADISQGFRARPVGVKLIKSQ